MSANVEGTGFNGEENDNNDEDNEFSQWMLSKDGGNAKRSLIKKLIETGIDSMEMLESIEDEFDILVKEMNLTTVQRIKLKSIIKNLPTKHSVIDKEETEAIASMQRKVASIQKAINLVADTKQNIDDEVLNHTKTINSTFKEFHDLLNKRELELITKLNKIANEKKNKLENASKTLDQQSTQSQQELNQCHKRLKKSIGLDAIEPRKKDILKIAKNIDNIKVVTKQDAVISDNKIDIALNKTFMIKTISSFGNVYTGTVPILLSLKDNNDCNVELKWKLNVFQENNNNNNNKLKIEWTERKSDDIDQVEAKWEYNKQFDLNNNNNDETVKVVIDNKTATYLFRVQYFDGNKWSRNSNIKSILIKQVMGDSWDTNCKHDELSIIGNSIVNTTGYQRSAYLTRVIKEGIHIWRFKVDKYTSGSQMIGIWKTKHDVVINNHLGGSGLDKCYAFAWNNSNSYKYGGGKDCQRWGVKCNNGDTLEMTLNLVDLTLSYKMNDKDLGKCFDVERTTYKGAVTLLSKDTKFTLLSYQYRAQ